MRTWRTILSAAVILATCLFGGPGEQAALARGRTGRSRSGGSYNNNNAAAVRAQQARDAAARAAAAKVAADESAIAQAEKKMNDIILKLRVAFDASGDWKAAQESMAEAQKAYTAAVAPVMAGLKENKDYKSAVTGKEAAEKVLENAKKDSDPATADKIQDLAQAALDARGKVTKAETDALASDPGVVAAKSTLVAAQAAMDQLRQTFEASIRENADWQAARKQLNDAQAKLAIDRR